MADASDDVVLEGLQGEQDALVRLAREAAAREVLEETGWRIAAPRRLGAFRKFAYMPEYDLWAEKICAIYLAHPVRQLGPPSEPGHTAIWTSPAVAVAQLANTGDRHFVSLLTGLV